VSIIQETTRAAAHQQMAGVPVNENVTQVANLLLFQVNNLGYIYRWTPAGFLTLSTFELNLAYCASRNSMYNLIHDQVIQAQGA
jgi:hypothetical protein